MIRELHLEPKKELLAMASHISFSCTPDWYGVTYKDLAMDLIFPKHREKHTKQPALLWICGGGYGVVNCDAWVPELMYYAQRGITVASIEYRTSNIAPFPAQLCDAKAAVRFLKSHAEQFCIDPDKIFAAGESAGGTIASLLGVTSEIREFDKGDYLDYDSKVAGVIDLYGPIDFKSECMLESDIVPSWAVSALLGENYGEEQLTSVNAVNYIGKSTPPFLIFHGIKDTTVSIKQSDLLYSALKKAFVSVDYYKVKDAGHGDDILYEEEIKDIILNFINKIVNK